MKVPIFRTVFSVLIIALCLSMLAGCETPQTVDVSEGNKAISQTQKDLVKSRKINQDTSTTP